MNFVPHTQALELKQLGFDELCWAWYNIPDEDVRYCYSEQRSPITNSHEEWSAQIWGKKAENIGLPTSSQVLKWFREKYNLFGCIDLQCSTPAHWYVRIDDIIENDFVYHSEDYHIKYNTYEEAELACLDRLIEIVKK